MVEGLSSLKTRSSQEHNQIAGFEYSNKENRAEQERSARALAQEGNYKAITNELEKSGLFDEQIKRVQEQVFVGFLTPENWKMLTTLELFDKSTFEHSVDTYHIARNKIEKVLDDQVIIAKLIEQEGVTLEQFYRACLFHDIGKVEIPNFLINNRLTDRDWVDILCRMVCDEHNEELSRAVMKKTGLSSGALSDEAHLRAVLAEKHIRAVKLVPIKEALTGEEIAELEARGFSSDMSLGKILEAHEEASERILREAQFDIEGKLVGQHHNYKGKKIDEMEIPIATSSLCISASLADVMHLADVQQALEQIRSYKTKQSKIQVLATLAHQAQLGYVSEYITYLWVSDEMKNVSSQELASEDNQADLLTIRALIKRYHTA
ncbi:MAG: HD domain-containing protein [Patescibacteria group bacterium]|nr:HD domain-containing protein [Patescibacteria group bacterium]